MAIQPENKCPPPDDAMTALSGEGELAGSVRKDTERKETQDNSNTALND
jgi:hypothetical protein